MIYWFGFLMRKAMTSRFIGKDFDVQLPLPTNGFCEIHIRKLFVEFFQFVRDPLSPGCQEALLAEEQKEMHSARVLLGDLEVAAI